MKIIYQILFLTLILFVECRKKEPVEQYTYSEKIVIAKTKEIRKASAIVRSATFYVIAFNDGYTQDVRFGMYSCINIGDTINFKKHIDHMFPRMILPCD